MSKIEITYSPGATPLGPNETLGLIPDYISTQSELNILEQDNITDAISWAKSNSHDELLTATFVFELHRKMLGRVWKWAGKVRTSNKNIGVMKEQIMNELGSLLQDTKYWIEHKTYPWDELAVRFHHRLVVIHVFSNGNGRHARLITNLLLENNGQDPFTWGSQMASTPIEVESTIRNNYITSLQAADRGNFSDLIKFAKS